MLEALSGLQSGVAEVVERLHEADGGLLCGERDHPEPAEVQPDHGDVPVGWRVIAPDSAKMGKGGELLRHAEVGFRQLQLLSQKGIASAGVEQPAGFEFVSYSITYA